jgi:outer membrane murein-binding lipoprotein Lpp
MNAPMKNTVKASLLKPAAMVLVASLLLAGCGSGGTDAAAPDDLATRAKEAEEKVRQQLDDAQKKAADQRDAVEADAE